MPVELSIAAWSKLGYFTFTKRSGKHPKITATVHQDRQLIDSGYLYNFFPVAAVGRDRGKIKLSSVDPVSGYELSKSPVSMHFSEENIPCLRRR